MIVALFLQSQSYMSEPNKSSHFKNQKSKVQALMAKKVAPKIRHKNKINGQQVIDIQQHQNVEKKTYDPSEMFLGSLSRKCNNFFDWICNTHSDSLPQLLWKNQMMSRANILYPELNNSQLARLVDRDWKYMPEQSRNKICESYRKLPSPYELEDQINNYELELSY